MAELPVDRPWMRVQLQRDDDASCYDSHRLQPIAPATWVTVEQVTHALRQLARSAKLPTSQRLLAEGALTKALAWVAARPPGGVSGRVSQTIQFERTNIYQGFRFDIENLLGQNLRS